MIGTTSNPRTKYDLARSITRSDVKKFHIFDGAEKQEHRRVLSKIGRLLNDKADTTIIVLKGRRS